MVVVDPACGGARVKHLAGRRWGRLERAPNLARNALPGKVHALDDLYHILR